MDSVEGENKGRGGGSSSILGGSKQTEVFLTISQFDDDLSNTDYVSDYLDQIVNLAQTQKIQLANMVRQIQALKEQVNERDRQIQRLKVELEQGKVQPSEFTINEDYKNILHILKRAREIGAIEEAERQKPKFKIDLNGNIEMLS